MRVPSVRVRPLRDVRPDPDGGFVLYWMIAQRRTGWNFALDRAVHWARVLNKPLLVFEPLRIDYPWASHRLHRFIIQGMQDNAARFRHTSAAYYPYVEPSAGAGRGLLATLAERAAVVVADDSPAFFLPRMLRAAAERITVRLEQVDANGILPLRATDTVFKRAHDFRRFLHKTLPEHLDVLPAADPLAGVRLPQLSGPPDVVTRRWPATDLQALLEQPHGLDSLALDSSVGPVDTAGGTTAARDRLTMFLTRDLPRYATDRNNPDADVTSRLSPYLHFGHISAHEIVHRLLEECRWSPARVDGDAVGRRRGWWGLDDNAESFLDELITWRELGFNAAAHQVGYDRYESLPPWARRTLDDHRDDPRPVLYAREQLEQAATDDPLWNAAQHQLRREGRIHGYLRMLWGKKILEWSPTPEEALGVMVQLNDTYALDGRDPNSVNGIFWVLGRYDRAWGPERPVFGKVRYMSSQNTRRKLSVTGYLATYGR